MTDRWIILRTSGARTLPLARSLAAAGFEVWTPIDLQVRRQPRTTKWHDVPAPITPTFVFVREGGLADIVRAAASPIRQHPQFSLLVSAGRVPFVADRSLDFLRAEEDRSLRRSQDRANKRAAKEVHHFPVGGVVKVKDEPAFLGMSGVVESCNGKKAWVDFGGALRMPIETWRLFEDVVSGALEPA